MNRPQAKRRPNRRRRRQQLGYTAFVCRVCGETYGDPAYVGPCGHCPPETCADCWFAHWHIAMAEHYRRERGDTGKTEAMLWLLWQGYSKQEAADLLRVSRKTVWRWLCRVRVNPDLMPDWLVSP